MGDVVGFRAKRLTGFLPDDLGAAELERRRAEDIEFERALDLIGFARTGQPTIIDPPDNLA